MNVVRSQFLDALAVSRPVLASTEVADQWHKASVLPEMNVAALVGHLLRAATTVVTYLESPVPLGKSPISPGEYSVEIVKTSNIHDPVHIAIRQRAEEEARPGHGAVVARWDGAVERITDSLASEPDHRLLAVAGGLIMRLDDYLVTRMVEVIVHTDDLALSVGLGTPTFRRDTMDTIFGHLLDVARTRHDDVAVLRAFARRERDEVDALRVF